jgi:hypothetical protein
MGDARGEYVDLAVPTVTGEFDPAVTEYEAHVTAPRHDDRILNISQSITLDANATRARVASFRVPYGYCAMVRYIANSLANAADFSSVTWTVRVDGSPLAGFANFIGLLSPGLYVPLPLRIDLAPNALIEVVASNSSSAAISGCSARLYGWGWAQGTGPETPL